MRVLVRLKKLIIFPMQIAVDIGVRSFIVLLEDSGIPILRSKIVQASAAPPKINASSSEQRDPITNSETDAPLTHAHSRQPPRGTHQIPREAKGKTPVQVLPSVENFGKSVEHGSGHGPSTEKGVVFIDTSRLTTPRSSLAMKKWSSGDWQESDAPMISLALGASAERGDTLCMNMGASAEGGDTLCMSKGNVIAPCSMAVDRPRDLNSSDDVGAMQTSSSLPRDQASPIDGDQSIPKELAPLMRPRDKVFNDGNNSNLTSQLNSPRDQVIQNQVDLLMGDEQLLGEKAIPDGPIILSKDGILSLDLSTTQEDFSKNSLISSKSLFSINSATGHHDQVNSSDPPFLGPSISSKSSSNTEISLTAATKTGSLPCHLRSLPPPMVIPEGYKWWFCMGDGL